MNAVPVSWPEAIAQLRRWLAGGPRQPRCEVPLAEPCDPLAWLAAQDFPVKVYWRDRESGFAAAGAGAAGQVFCPRPGPVEELLDQARRLLPLDFPHARCYGGMAFHIAAGEAAADEWAPFGAARFILPRFELQCHGDAPLLACNLVANSPAELEREAARAARVLDRVQPPGTPVAEPPPPSLVTHRQEPDLDGWTQAVDAALAEIRQRRLQKVVLARRSCLEFGAPLPPGWWLRRLTSLAPQCYHFLCQFDHQVAFLGATPELLCERQARELRTEAIAGTRRRGATPAADDALAAELLASAKERREHQFVVDCLTQALGPLCHSVEQDSLAVLRLARLQHLCVHVRGTLRDDVSDATLLAALHPTPAVGGWPRRAAFARIASLEPFARGWYAGPVGWLGHDALQLGVGIRSALCHGPQLTLYAGAGIVRGSVAAQEWQELDDKLGHFVNGILGAG